MLRKERVHLTGLSNADFRLPSTASQRRERKPLYEARYKVHELNLGLAQTQANTQSQIPPETTREAPAANLSVTAKQSQSATKLSRPRTAALTMQKGVIGGDNDPYIPLAIQKSKGIERREEPEEPPAVKSVYHITKDIEHRKASQETQLVPMVTTKTAEGTINAKKIVDLRRAMRRRYASRSNFRKIFNAWDINSQGIVTADDIMQMLNKIGITINAEETQGLVTSITGLSEPTLKIDDFLGLVFDDCDTVNVDLGNLPQKFEKFTVNFRDLEPDLKTLALSRKTELLQGTMKEYLQHKLTDLSRLMLKADQVRSGVVSFESFCDVMKKTELPPHMLNPAHLKQLFEDGGGTTTKGLNYKIFCDEIKNYVKPSERMNSYDFKEANPLVRDIAEKGAMMRRVKTASESLRTKTEEMMIVDPRIQPYNKLETLHNKAARPRNMLQDAFTSEEALTKALEAHARSSAITREQLYNFVTQHVKGFNKTEAENFLSSYVYNPQGVTDIALVAKHVFSDELQASYLLQRKARVYPPMRPKTAYTVTESDIVSSKRILKEIESNLLDTGTTSSYELFKKFDVDKDGYVSTDDFANALNAQGITSTKREAEALMGMLDDAKRGYLTVTEFASRIQPNIIKANATRLREREEKFQVGVQPSTQFLENQLKNAGRVTQFYSELNASLQPPTIDEFFKRPKTSYQPKRSDNIIQALPNTPSYLPEQQRLDRKSVNPINIDLEDRDRKQRCQTAKANRARTANDRMLQRVGEIEGDIQQRADMRVYHKAVRKEEYERRCHMYYG
mmetsp:Transcript_10558/g.20327  ORF Transcript_10558/g.20327 Transcript_10558/m.20327 type:complete len:793 (+) Transcript_10558:196-2574(+)